MLNVFGKKSHALIPTKAWDFPVLHWQERLDRRRGAFILAPSVGGGRIQGVRTHASDVVLECAARLVDLHAAPMPSVFLVAGPRAARDRFLTSPRLKASRLAMAATSVSCTVEPTRSSPGGSSVILLEERAWRGQLHLSGWSPVTSRHSSQFWWQTAGSTARCRALRRRRDHRDPRDRQLHQAGLQSNK
jgi:hypothetical protein